MASCSEESTEQQQQQLLPPFKESATKGRQKRSKIASTRQKGEDTPRGRHSYSKAKGNPSEPLVTATAAPTTAKQQPASQEKDPSSTIGRGRRRQGTRGSSPTGSKGGGGGGGRGKGSNKTDGASLERGTARARRGSRGKKGRSSAPTGETRFAFICQSALKSVHNRRKNSIFISWTSESD